MDLNTTGQEVHLTHYWNIIYKRWKVAVSILIVVMAGTFLASYFSKPLFRSAITIQIERDNPNQLTLDDFFGIAASEQEFLQTQYVLLKSRGLAERVIEEHKLLSDPDFYPAGIAGKTPAEIRVATDSMVNSILGTITIVPVRNTSLVEISCIASTPRLSQKIAEAWGDSFMRMNVDKKLDNVRQASDFIARQIAQVRADLDKSRTELQQYGESKDIVSVNDTSNVVMQKLLQLNTDVTAAQNDRIQRQSDYNAVVSGNPETVAGSDPIVARLSDDLSRLQREYNEKLSTLKAGHPTMLQLDQQIEQTRQARARAITQAYAQARNAAQAAYSAAAARESTLRGVFDQQKRETLKLNANAMSYFDLRTAVEAKQAMLATLQKQQSETEVAARLRGSASSNIHWVDHAELPGARFNVTMKKNLQSAFPLGVILGLAAIFFLEYMDRSIKTPEELERVTKFASLGIIPAASSVSRSSDYSYGRGNPKLRAVETPPVDTQQGIELIPHTDGRAPISEAYRAFRTSMLLASASSPKIIVITSSFAREGKTTTSVNLATVLAQMGKPVLLIDADLRRPRLQKVFRGKMNLGLVNYLAANIPLEDVIQDTAVPNLSVVLSGPIPPNPSELLASDRMRHLIEEVRAKYAYVIFDSPPILAVTDSVVLASKADGVVLTVHGGHTPREHVMRSAERLRQANIPVLGALLNNLDLEQYGYAYKKSYYDYYEADDTAQERQRKSS
ncbi:MAG TPA: polysaccharide biosynthesis tyrosine autokinase [Thermoanaerobaculia bacterium]|jgi:capsular exopolysaccharide synthesis family protein